MRGAKEFAAGETHTRNHLLHLTMADWLSEAAKRAKRSGRGAAQTPPVTSKNMIAACAAATSFLFGAGVEDVDYTVQQIARRTLFNIMVFSWYTMLHPDNLL